MKIKHWYLLGCILGIALPLRHFVPFLWEHGLNVVEFSAQIYATRIGAFFAADVVVSAIILIIFMSVEIRRLNIRGGWYPILGLTVGVSLALPWFLYLREAQKEQLTA